VDIGGTKVGEGSGDRLREYDTVARADNYFAEYRMLFSRRNSNERDILPIKIHCRVILSRFVMKNARFLFCS
jgi:hypothetical protein